MRIYFDLDGTLLDVSVRHYEVYRSVCALLGGQPLSFEEFWSMKKRSHEGEILEKSGIASEKFASYRRMFGELIEREEFLVRDRPSPDSLKTIGILRGMGHRVILVTLRKSDSKLRQELRNLDILSAFDEILTAKRGVHAGPHVAKAQVIKDSKHYVKRDSIIVGDTEVDVLAGRLLGVRVIALRTGQRDEEVLGRYGPDFLISEISELPSIIDATFKAT